MKRLIAPAALGLATVLSLSACTNPYDPGQRAAGGALLGAGAGAAIGAAAGGGRGAATGALIGGAAGALGGVATTPQSAPPGYYRRDYYDDGYRRPAYPPPGYYEGPPPGYYR